MHRSLTVFIEHPRVKNGLLETIWLLAASVVVVPLVVRGLPGGTPVLGFLVNATAQF